MDQGAGITGKDAGNSSYAALTHTPQLHPSPPELDCRQEQHDESGIHDCVHQFGEMVGADQLRLT